MGTNFYWRTPDMPLLPTGEPMSTYRDDPALHIGKRSAAGKYCWDCDQTLCAGGNAAIHYNKSAWWDNCPKCGKAPIKTADLSSGAAAIELGFAEPETKRPAGVSSTSSFSWAQDPERVGAICDARPDEQIIEDEYGDLFTGREFKTMLLANCAIQFADTVGVRFS